jgi:hypothetical protein
MKKVIIFSVSIFLGILAGYFAAPFLSMWVAESADPEAFYGSMLARVKSSVVCDCNGLPASESVKELSGYLSTLQTLRDANKSSKMLVQEIGLTDVRLSIIEKKLDQRSQAEEDMKRGQIELASLGWKDVSSQHLTALVNQLNSEYKPAGQKSKSETAAIAPNK